MREIPTLNVIFPKMDLAENGPFYDQENQDTAVVYCAVNVMNCKAYIGSAYSFVHNGKQGCIKYGGYGRFVRHWTNSHGDYADTECPVFYEALKNSEPDHWFIRILEVGTKKHIKRLEAKHTRAEKTYNPKYGYNYFLGDQGPLHEDYRVISANKKAANNVSRAANGAMRQNEKTKGLPCNINFRSKITKQGTLCEGYFVQIKLGPNRYSKYFSESTISLPERLKLAVEWLAKVKELVDIELKKGNFEKIDVDDTGFRRNKYPSKRKKTPKNRGGSKRSSNGKQIRRDKN